MTPKKEIMESAGKKKKSTCSKIISKEKFWNQGKTLLMEQEKALISKVD